MAGLCHCFTTFEFFKDQIPAANQTWPAGKWTTKINDCPLKNVKNLHSVRGCSSHVRLPEGTNCAPVPNGTLIELPPQRRQSRSQLLRGVHGAGHGSGRVAAADAAEAGTSAAGTCLGALGYGSNFKICKTCKTTDLNTLI